MRINFKSIVGLYASSVLLVAKNEYLERVLCPKLKVIWHACLTNRYQISKSFSYLTHKYFYDLHLFNCISVPTLPTCNEEYEPTKECYEKSLRISTIALAFYLIATAFVVRRYIRNSENWSLKINQKQYQEQDYTVRRFWFLGIIPSPVFYYGRAQNNN